jgi:hypothetical protein
MLLSFLSIRLDHSQVEPGAPSPSIAFRRIRIEEAVVMSSVDPATPHAQEKVPFMQRVLDNPFLLLFLGVTLPTVLYLIWGVMEIASVPLAK